MRKKKPAWPADIDLAQRFPHPTNTSVVAFLTNGSLWSAHSDPAEEFYFGLKEIPDAKVYCPDIKSYAYHMAYTPHGVIFGLVIGLSSIYLRLPQSQEWAKSNCRNPFPEMGPEWYEFLVNYDRGFSSSKWLRRAYDEAVALT